MAKYTTAEKHSGAWIFQSWASFAISISATLIGILYTPTDSWVKGYLSMGLLFSIGSTISLSKTVRDMHESNKLLSRVDEAKLERILSEHNPFKE